ncbi:hypothetical protein [Streptomyces sp. NPDC053427]|uniref:hypothetical protein n=1 Tax=Streptomyces sp. NPDC053427 TaxID=3365701 RepID=UPI0037CE1DDA
MTGRPDAQHAPETCLGHSSRPWKRAQLLQQTLTGLRDHLGAAVYVSSYTNGDVNVLQYADGPEAPAMLPPRSVRHLPRTSRRWTWILARWLCSRVPVLAQILWTAHPERLSVALL